MAEDAHRKLAWEEGQAKVPFDPQDAQRFRMAFERLSSAHPLTCRPLAVGQDVLQLAKGSLATTQGRSDGKFRFKFRFLTVGSPSYNLITILLRSGLLTR